MTWLQAFVFGGWWDVDITWRCTFCRERYIMFPPTRSYLIIILFPNSSAHQSACKIRVDVYEQMCLSAFIRLLKKEESPYVTSFRNLMVIAGIYFR